MKNITFKINDFNYITNKHLTIIQACLKNKIDVPRFCYHEKLSIAGNCRMCLVEDIKQLKPIASCAITVSNNMTLYTNTVKVKKARESVLEFLLANHPLDCPICDQGGECDLQDQSIVFGGDRGRFYEFKRAVENKDCGPLIKTIMNRCIHCTRCVRFSTEIGGNNFLGITGRGSKMEIGFYIKNIMNNELSGNIIDLCPVGALTSKPFAFTARPWELKSNNSIDILDSLGSNIRIDIRGTKIMRILPRFNERINEDWITDKIRFCYDGLKRQRLYEPLLKVNNIYLKLSWKKIFFFIKNLFFKYINNIILSKKKYFFIKNYIGNYLDIESLFILKNFTNKLGNNFYNIVNNNDFREYYLFNSSVSKINNADICLLINTNLRLELPLINLKIRQSFLKNKMLVYNIGFYSTFNYYIKHLGINLKILLNILEGLHWICNKLIKINSKNPLIIFSNNNKLFNKIAFNLILSNLHKYTNILHNDWLGLNLLNNNITDFSKNEINITNSIFNNSINKNIFFIYYLLGFDDINFDFSKIKNNYIIYQGHHGDISVNFSNIILPSTVFIEKNSLYLNLEGIIQKNQKIFNSLGNSRDDWKIIYALSEILNINLGLKNSLIIFKKLTKNSPFFFNNLKNNIFIPLNINNYYFIFNNIFVSKINYYYNDLFSRVSKTLTLCSIKFKIKNYNFII